MSRTTRRMVPAAVCAMLMLALLWPSDAAAQRRGRRIGVRSAVFIGAPYYYPGFYYYDPFFWGWYDQYPVGPFPPYYGRPLLYDNTGSARLQVSPRNTEVYIDGFFVGTVDDYDGFLQRLHVAAGEHQLQLYLEGYQPLSQKVLFRRGTTLKINHTMQPLPAGQASEQRPQPDPTARAQERRPQGRPGPQRPGERSDFGTLAVRVQPSDATVLIDGEQWEGASQDGRLLIDVADGPHRVEVRKNGYRTYSRTVQVRRGETMTLNVSLSQQ